MKAFDHARVIREGTRLFGARCISRDRYIDNYSDHLENVSRAVKSRGNEKTGAGTESEDRGLKLQISDNV